MFKTKYRVVLDAYSGFEAQYRKWWMPFWLQINGVNTSSSLDAAKVIIKAHREYRKVLWKE